MFILNHAINSLSVKDNRKLKTGGKKVTFQNVNFLNHWLQNTRSCGKKKFFPENTIFKGIIFWYFQTATCYNSSLVHSKSKRSVLAPKMGPFRWVKYSPIFGAKRAHFEWGRFGPDKRGRNSPLLSGQNKEAKGLFWKNGG